MRIRMTYGEVRDACFTALFQKGLLPEDVAKFSKSTVIPNIDYTDEAEKLNQDLIEFEFTTKTFTNDWK